MKIEGLGGSVALFFRLAVDIEKIRRILKKNKFEMISSPPLEVSVGMLATPAKEAIAKKDNAIIRYDAQRYLMDIVGFIEDFSDLLDILVAALGKSGYDMKKMVRYLEFNTRLEEKTQTNIYESINKDLNLESFSKIAELLNEQKLKAFEINLSNLDNPLNDKWLSFRVSPDINSSNILRIQITKRTETFAEMKSFLGTLNNNFEAIIEFFKGVEE